MQKRQPRWLYFVVLGVVLGGLYASIAQAEQLRIRSRPAGASLYINGTYKGRTPFSTSVPSGRYHVEIRRKGFLTWTSYIQVPQRSELAVRALLEKSGGSLRAGAPPAGTLPPPRTTGSKRGGLLIVNTTPAGVAVYTNGRLLGRTPMLKFLPIGSHTLTFRQDGFHTVTRRVRISSARSVRLKLSLNAKSGGATTGRTTTGASTQLMILCQPAARAYLNHRYLGRTPVITAGISPGSYQLTLKRKGYRVYRRNIKLYNGQQMRIRAKLVRK